MAKTINQTAIHILFTKLAVIYMYIGWIFAPLSRVWSRRFFPELRLVFEPTYMPSLLWFVSLFSLILNGTMEKTVTVGV